jgi:hypothetical protein
MYESRSVNELIPVAVGQPALGIVASAARQAGLRSALNCPLMRTITQLSGEAPAKGTRASDEGPKVVWPRRAAAPSLRAMVAGGDVFGAVTLGASHPDVRPPRMQRPISAPCRRGWSLITQALVRGGIKRFGESESNARGGGRT